MKIKGKEIKGPNREIVILPRGNGGDDIVLTCQAVLDYGEFSRLCPFPKPPTKIVPGKKGPVPDFEDKYYKAEVHSYSTKKTHYMILKSLEPSEIEWETVTLGDPNTWANFETELTAAGFTDIECQRIMAGVMTANCLNQEKLDEARERFYQGQDTPSND